MKNGVRPVVATVFRQGDSFRHIFTKDLEIEDGNVRKKWCNALRGITDLCDNFNSVQDSLPKIDGILDSISLLFSESEDQALKGSAFMLWSILDKIKRTGDKGAENTVKVANMQLKMQSHLKLVKVLATDLLEFYQADETSFDFRYLSCPLSQGLEGGVFVFYPA